MVFEYTSKAGLPSVALQVAGLWLPPSGRRDGDHRAVVARRCEAVVESAQP